MKGTEIRRPLVAAAVVKVVLSGAALAAVLAAGGCNTVKGVGHDITAVGEGGQQLIDDATGNSTSARRR